MQLARASRRHAVLEGSRARTLERFPVPRSGPSGRPITALDGTTPPFDVVPDDAPWLVVPDARYAIGRDDGAILLRPSTPRTLADLHRALAALGSP